MIEDLLKWTPESDKEARFNISHTPLAKRFLNDSTPLGKDSKVPGIIALMAPYTTDNHPSQGFASVEQYAFPYWQYIDHFVQWGGSAAVGIILPPLATWTDAAHKNGVTSIGTVFFPPNVYGGKEEWVYEFLEQKADGSFPTADKLIEVAKTYNFDGWFINQETYNLKEGTAEKMIDWVSYYKQNSELNLVWYDAMIDDSRVIWQDELNDHNQVFFQKGDQVMSDAFFINFRFSPTNLEDSKKAAQNLNRSEWDVYAGIDVQAKSFRTPAKWEQLFGEKSPKNTSIGLYFSNSTFNVSKTKKPEDVYESEQKFWNGGTEIKTRFGTSTWEGFTKYFEPRSVINKLPFKTNFNYGLGYFYKENGKVVSDKEWHNLSIQDILPTWQWKVDSLKVKPNFSFNESFEGGSSLSFNAQSDAKIPLYKTNIDLSKTAKFEIVAKSDPKVQVQFYLELSNGEVRNFKLEKSKEWKKTSFAIPSLKGLYIVSLGIKTIGEGQAFLGEILVYHKKEKRLLATKFTTEVFSNGSNTEIYFHFEKNLAAFHNIYILSSKNEKIWLGKTASQDYYISSLPTRASVVRLIVEPIAKDGSEGESKMISITL